MKLDKSKAAIVTGGASGLGSATARMLAAEGVKVAKTARASGVNPAMGGSVEPR